MMIHHLIKALDVPIKLFLDKNIFVFNLNL